MKKILAVILARSGSKGVPKKNIKILCGHPLISYSIYAGLKSKLINKLIVSTDSKIISRISKNYGAEVPFLRPKKLSTDKVWSRDALKHAVLECEKKYREIYDYIIELPAVAPLRTATSVDLALKKLIANKKLDSVISVVRIFDNHPIRIKIIKNDLIKEYNKTLKEIETSRRQDLPACYARNGAIYAMKRSTIIKNFTRVGKRSAPLIMSQEESVNIDELKDFYLAESLIKKGYCKNFPAKIYKNNEIHHVKCPIKNSKVLLVCYPREVCYEIVNKLKKKFHIIYCDIDNINKISNKYIDNVFALFTALDGKIFISEKELKRFKNLKIIISASTGLTHLDLNYIKNKNIKLIYLDTFKKTKNILSSSEFTFTLIMSLIRKVKKSIDVVNSYNWRNFHNQLRAHEISYYKFGIFGYGRIGKNVHKYLKSFGAKVKFFDPNIKKNKKYKISNIKKFLESINFLIITAKLNSKTNKFFDYSKLSILEKSSLIVNIARGELIVEKDLLKLLKNKHIAGVGLDVLSSEDKIYSGKNKLINYSLHNDNVLITPHIAGLAFEAEKLAISKVINDLDILI